MNYVERFLSKRRIELRQLSHEKICLFMLLVCENMLPAYQIFTEEEKWGRPQVLKDILSLLEESIWKKKLSKSLIKKLDKELDGNSPDTAEFENPKASYALDSCAAFGEALLYLQEREIEYVINVMRCTLDTVDMYIQIKHDYDPNDIKLDEKIEKDEFMQNEFNRQTKLLTELNNLQTLNSEVIQRFKFINERFGKVIDLEAI